MNDEVKPLRSKKVLESGTVANVGIRVRKVPCCFAEPVQVPERIARRAEENAAHVVVDSEDAMALPVKVRDGFRADQSARTGHQDGFLHA